MISPFAGFTIVVVASAKLPIHSLKELVDYAKAHPGELNYGSVGIGSSQHLAGEYFAQLNGVKLTHIPYRNIAQYGPDLISGTVQLGFQWYPNVAGPIQSKGANALAVAGDKRLAIIPDAPTSTEAGMPRVQRTGLVRAAGAARHAAADPRKAEQGNEGRHRGSAGEEGFRGLGRRAAVDAARSGKEVAS